MDGVGEHRRSEGERDFEEGRERGVSSEIDWVILEFVRDNVTPGRGGSRPQRWGGEKAAGLPLALDG